MILRLLRNWIFAIDIIINLLLGYEELRIYSFTVNASFDIEFVSTVKELNVRQKLL